MQYLPNHAAHVRPVLADDRLPDPPQPQRSHGRALIVGAPGEAAHERDLELAHAGASPSADGAVWSRRLGAISSTGRPRIRATSSGRRRSRNPATAACTMLIAFSLPSDLDRTSAIPAHSMTA